MRRPPATAARIASHAAAISPRPSGSCAGSAPSRNARARVTSSYPRRTSTAAVVGLSSSPRASTATASRSQGSISQATASTRAPTTRPEIAAALALMSNDSSHGYPLLVPEPSYSSGDDYVVEFLGFRFSFNAFDFEQRVTAAAVKLGLVAGNDLDDDETADLVELTADGRIAEPRSGLGLYLVRHWEQLSLVGGESLVYWLRKLVFRGAWLDHWVKDGRLDVAWEDETGARAYVDPNGERGLH